MPNPVTSKLPKPKSEDEFEDLAADVLARHWRATVHRHGRRGQRQQGVDLYATPRQLSGDHAGAQCKNVDALAISDVRAEALKAEAFSPALAEFWIVTSVDRDANLQSDIRALSDERRRQGKFPVAAWFWQDIEREVAGHRDLLEKYYGAWMVPAVPSPVLPDAPDRPHVDWGSFYALPSDTGPRAQAYLQLVAIPKRPAQLVVDGDLLELFRQQVEHAFGVADPSPPRDRTYYYAVDLQWRHALNVISRHWRRGQDGSVGFATTIENAWQRGVCSLWEVGLDSLLFLRLANEVLQGEDVELALDFQPGSLQPTPMPLAPEDRRKAPLACFPMSLQPADPSAIYGPVNDDLSAVELSNPFAKLAGLLIHRWRVMFRLPSLRGQPLAADLRQLAASELGWVVVDR